MWKTFSLWTMWTFFKVVHKLHELSTVVFIHIIVLLCDTRIFIITFHKVVRFRCLKDLYLATKTKNKAKIICLISRKNGPITP